MQWYSLALKGLNLKVSDFWRLPFFVLVDLIRRLNPVEKEQLTRIDIIHSMVDTRQRLGWL